MTATQFNIFTRAVLFVTIRCSIPISDLDSSCRRAPVVFARNILIHILRHQASMTLQEIALLLKRHHTAIFHSLQSLENDTQTDCAKGREVAALISEFSARSNE